MDIIIVDYLIFDLLLIVNFDTVQYLNEIFLRFMNKTVDYNFMNGYLAYFSCDESHVINCGTILSEIEAQDNFLHQNYYYIIKIPSGQNCVLTESLIKAAYS